MARLRTLTLVLGLVSLLSGQGGADEEKHLAAAREHARAGNKAYDLGRYLEAAKHYEAAYELRDDAALLFNSAQAYRLGGDYANAIRAYRSFLRREPKASNRSDVEGRIVELQRALDEKERAKAAAPERPSPPPTAQPTPVATPVAVSSPTPATQISTTPNPQETRPIYKRWWLWTAVGGVVAAGLAVGLGVGLAPPPAGPSAVTTGGTFSPFGK